MAPMQNPCRVSPAAAPSSKSVADCCGQGVSHSSSRSEAAAAGSGLSPQTAAGGKENSSRARLGPPPPPPLRRADAALTIPPRCARVLGPTGSVSSADVRDRARQTTRDSGKVVVVGGGGLVSSTPPGGAGDRVSRQCVTRADVRSHCAPRRIRLGDIDLKRRLG